MRLLDRVQDSRKRPRIKTKAVIFAAWGMCWMRLGSLNALEQTRGNPFWSDECPEGIGSADTQARIFRLIDCQALRRNLAEVYHLSRRNKALSAQGKLPGFLVIDGHEQTQSYLRRCSACLERTPKDSSKIQYYHRHVTAVLVLGKSVLFLDMEMQRPGEDEVTCAMRLLQRILKSYPRAFEVILADGLYAQGRFFKLAQEFHKDVIAVLKDDRRLLFQDAMGLFKTQEPILSQTKSTQKQIWDIEGFDSWDGFGKPVRVVRSLETTTRKRQATGLPQTKQANWLWVTTLSKEKVESLEFVELAHKRWMIENEGFNSLVNQWHADHVYTHDPNALEAFWLTLMFCCNLFYLFIERNLKLIFRSKHTTDYWVSLIASEFYSQIPDTS